MATESRASGRATPPRLPGLDGLRGLAVLAVLLFHDGRLAGGWLGVDLFFVLSGFLITKNLLAEHEGRGRIDLRAFWVRRARRLFPALLALVFVVAVAAQLVASPEARARIRDDGLAALAYVANWHTIVSGRSYWDLFSSRSPFEHTWSLAIEEQFYVAWPLVATLALRAKRPRLALGLVAAVLTLASAVALAHAYAFSGVDRAYLGTDTRAAAILSGATLACALHGRAIRHELVRWLDVAGFIAMAGLAFAWLRLGGHDPFVYSGGLWLTELAALVLVVCATTDRSRVARALAFRPLAWLGLVSYGVYLAHWPIFIALAPGRFGLAGAWLTLVRVALTLLVAAASFRWLEVPIRRHGLPFGRARVVTPVSFAVAAVSLVAATTWRARAPIAQAMTPPPPAPTGPRVLVLGDSVAATLGARMAEQAGLRGARVVTRGIVECSVLDGVLPTRSVRNLPHRGGNCAERWAADVAEVHPDVTLVVLGGAFLASARVDGHWQWSCDAGFQRAYSDELSRRLDAIASDAGRLVLSRVPRPVGAWGSAAMIARASCFDSVIDRVAARLRTPELDLAHYLCPDTTCRLESHGEPIRSDGLHFWGHGADATAQWVLDTLLP